MADAELEERARALLDLCRRKKLTIATAESCTGGLVAAALTEIPGSSDVVERGFVTYSNAAKQAMLGVPAATLKKFGAVSRETAEAMAAGGLHRSRADHCLAITGIAGPDGGTPDKPVGTVWIALASRVGPAPRARRFLFAGGREPVRAWSVASALAMLRLRLIGEDGSPLLREVAS